MSTNYLIYLLIIFAKSTLLWALSDYSVCGKNDGPKTFHIAGPANNYESNPVGHWPWMASIGFYDSNQSWTHQCGATLISDHQFLTAAHCATNSRWKIRLGDFDHASVDDDDELIVLDIEAIHIHPKFDQKAAYFDVAVLETKTVQFSLFKSPVCLPTRMGADLDKYDNHQTELIGWGASHLNGKTSNALKRVSLQVFPQDECNRTHVPLQSTKTAIETSLPALFQSNVMCAGSNIAAAGSCKGDSGGPLMFKQRDIGQWFQIAIVEGGIGDCGNNYYPGIFVRLEDDEVQGFISSVLGRGTLYFPNGDSFEGDTKDGKIGTFGTYTYSRDDPNKFDKYIGYFKDGKKHGQGTLTTKDGLVYEGNFSDDKYEGMGTLTFSRDESELRESYVGNYHNGLMHGQGNLIWKNGAKYVGEFTEGLIQGYGIVYYNQNSTKDKYQGNIVKDKYEGFGKLIWKTGDIYEGNFAENKYEGMGTLTFSRDESELRETYVGNYHNGLMHGQGNLIWKNGDKYVGEFTEGLIQGYGIVYYNQNSTKDNYQGNFLNDDYEGFGKLIWKSGIVYEGNFAESKYEGMGTLTFSRDESEPRESYVGNYHNGLMHGQGKLIWKNGDKYVGEFTEGLRNGFGIVYFEQNNLRDRYEGNFVKDKYEGFGKLFWHSGEIYEGNFVDDQYEGLGTLTFAKDDSDGREKYIGNFHQNKMNGQGKMTWKDGRVLEGNFVHGKPEQ